MTVLGYRTDAFPGFYRRRLGLDAGLVGGRPGAGGGGLSPRAGNWVPGAVVVANPLPGGRAARPRRCTTGCSPRASRAGGGRRRAARTSPRPCSSTSTGPARGHAGGQRPPGTAQRGAGRRGSPWRWRGDPGGRRRRRRRRDRRRGRPRRRPAPGSDRPARIVHAAAAARRTPRPWLAGLGVDGRRWPAGSATTSPAGLAVGLAAAGVGTAVAVDPGVPTGTIVSLVGPGGSAVCWPTAGPASSRGRRRAPARAASATCTCRATLLDAGSCAAGSRGAGGGAGGRVRGLGGPGLDRPARELRRRPVAGRHGRRRPAAAQRRRGCRLLTGCAAGTRPRRAGRRGRRGRDGGWGRARAGWSGTVCAPSTLHATTSPTRRAPATRSTPGCWRRGSQGQARKRRCGRARRGGGGRQPARRTSWAARCDVAVVQDVPVDHRAVETRVARLKNLRSGLQRGAIGW